MYRKKLFLQCALCLPWEHKAQLLWGGVHFCKASGTLVFLVTDQYGSCVYLDGHARIITSMQLPIVAGTIVELITVGIKPFRALPL